MAIVKLCHSHSHKKWTGWHSKNIDNKEVLNSFKFHLSIRFVWKDKNKPACFSMEQPGLCDLLSHIWSPKNGPVCTTARDLHCVLASSVTSTAAEAEVITESLEVPGLELRPCPSRCANEELHLHQRVGGYSSGATYSRSFCRCVLHVPDHVCKFWWRSGVGQSREYPLFTQAALSWYGDCDGLHHLPTEAADDHARESLSLLGMSQCAMQTHGVLIVPLSASSQIMKFVSFA